MQPTSTYANAVDDHFDPTSLTGADDDVPIASRSGPEGETEIDGAIASGDEDDEVDPKQRFKYHDDEPLDLKEAWTDGQVVWLLKVPDTLMDRWNKVKQPGKILGKLRVYDPEPGKADRSFELVVPNAVEEEEEEEEEKINDEDVEMGEGEQSQDNFGESSMAPSTSMGGNGDTKEAMRGSSSVPSTTSKDTKPKINKSNFVTPSDSKQSGAGGDRPLSEEEQYTVYTIEDGDDFIPVSQKNRRWLYWERDRKVGFYGKSRFRAYPRLLARASKEAVLVPKLSAAARAQQIRDRYNHPSLQKTRIKLLADENLTRGQMNTLVSGAPATVIKNTLYNRLAERAAQHESGGQPGTSNAAADAAGSPPPGSAPGQIGASPPKRGKPARERTVALPEGPLRDAIAGEFEKYKYWSFKALKERLNQPENHLKKVLASMAVVEKSGPYRNYWTPRLDLPIFKHQDVGEVGELAPEQQESVPTLAPRRDDGDDDDEDEDEEMANEDDDMEEVEV